MLALDGLMDGIKKRASGTTFKEVSGSEFGETLIPIPPLTEQVCIIDCSESMIQVIE
jgi:type I restriction enzyme S subunit